MACAIERNQTMGRLLQISMDYKWHRLHDFGVLVVRLASTRGIQYPGVLAGARTAGGHVPGWGGRGLFGMLQKLVLDWNSYSKNMFIRFIHDLKYYPTALFV